jgi:hypothetical protein
MARLKPGDRVDCRISLSAIISPYDPDYDEVKTFEIVSKDKSGYYLFIPRYILLKGTMAADKYLCKKLGIDKRFLDEQIIYLQEGMIYKIHSIMDGCVCTKCNDFYYQAQPNREDGTLICWSCRRDPYR